MNLGRLKKVELRDVWKSEAQDFTPWLAREENLSLLGDAIGLDLELEAVEENVGPFRAGGRATIRPYRIVQAERRLHR